MRDPAALFFAAFGAGAFAGAALIVACCVLRAWLFT